MRFFCIYSNNFILYISLVDENLQFYGIFPMFKTTTDTRKRLSDHLRFSHITISIYINVQNQFIMGMAVKNIIKNDKFIMQILTNPLAILCDFFANL